MGNGEGHTNGSRRATSSDAAAFQGVVPDGSEQAHPTHRRHASELAGGNAPRVALDNRCPSRPPPPPPPYRRSPAANGNGDNGAAQRAEDINGGGRAYESSAYVARAPYARIASALEGGNEHIARHEEVRRMGTDARVLQEKVYGPAAPSPGRAPMTPERRTISVRTRR
jgi:hypothetical protein